MKCLFLFAALLISVSAFAKIITVDNRVYLRSKGKQVPVFLVNSLIEKGEVSKLKLYGDGEVHMISFAKSGEKEKLYSVDEKGFMYTIEPFSSYEVSTVENDGRFRFKQVPKKKFRVNEKGFFLN